MYLFGHSGGGHHVLQLGLLESEYFAGVAAHAGALIPSFFPAIEKAPRRIPIALWIGTDDQVVPIKFVRDTYDALLEQSFPAKLTELKTGVAPEQAQAEVNTLAARLETSYPTENKGKGLSVIPLREDMVGDVLNALFVLLGAVIEAVTMRRLPRRR